MFTGCVHLIGGKVRKWDEQKQKKTDLIIKCKPVIFAESVCHPSSQHPHNILDCCYKVLTLFVLQLNPALSALCPPVQWEEAQTRLDRQDSVAAPTQSPAPRRAREKQRRTGRQDGNAAGRGRGVPSEDQAGLVHQHHGVQHQRPQARHRRLHAGGKKVAEVLRLRYS